MNQEEYLQTQTSLLMIEEIVKKLELREFLQWIGRADALGPILDPTLYREASESMDHIRKIAEVVIQLQ